MDLIGATVAALPVPPMPIMVNRVDTNGKQITGYANTHHILSQAILFAMRRDCKKDNTVRQHKQIQLTDVFIAAFRDSLNTPENLYIAAMKFTREYLHCFMPTRTVPDARFAPYDEIRTSTYRNNPIVRSSCEHLAGLIFYDESGERPYDDVLAPLQNLPFCDILCKYRDVHTARGIQEEADKIHQLVEIL
jgi:hypothetical protein